MAAAGLSRDAGPGAGLGRGGDARPEPVVQRHPPGLKGRLSLDGPGVESD